MLSKAGEIRRDEACLDYSGGDVVLYPCHGSKGNQVRNFARPNHRPDSPAYTYFPRPTAVGVRRGVQPAAARLLRQMPGHQRCQEEDHHGGLQSLQGAAALAHGELRCQQVLRAAQSRAGFGEWTWPAILANSTQTNTHTQNGTKTAASHARSFHSLRTKRNEINWVNTTHTHIESNI